MPVVDVIIPALNEAGAIGKVIADIPKELVRQVVVVDNGSTDRTAEVAREAGAVVLSEPQKGYGKACLTGLQYLAEGTIQPDIVMFLDGDHADDPREMDVVIQPILNSDVDMVIGSRVLGERETGSLTVPQQFGNWLATRLMSMFYGVKYTDLGPFRAIKYSALQKLNMVDENYGWTVEMQVKAARQGLKTSEVPVSYRNRIGQSKVSGTVKGSFMAGYKILKTIFQYA